MIRILLLTLFFPLIQLSFGNSTNTHPYYISVTEIEYINTNKEIGIACKIFADDFEQALKTVYQTKVDLYHPADTALLARQIRGYINQHLQLVTAGKPLVLQYLGFEIEGEAAWCYFSCANIQPFTNIQVFNNLLYEYKKEQVNLVHVKVNGARKSARLTTPETRLSFDF